MRALTHLCVAAQLQPFHSRDVSQAIHIPHPPVIPGQVHKTEPAVDLDAAPGIFPNVEGFEQRAGLAAGCPDQQIGVYLLAVRGVVALCWLCCCSDDGGLWVCSRPFVSEVLLENRSRETKSCRIFDEGRGLCERMLDKKSGRSLVVCLGGGGGGGRT